MRPVVFATWDGPGTNYLASLFLPIFDALRPYGYAFSVIQHTFAEAEAVVAEAQASATRDIPYRAVRVSNAWRKVGLPLIVMRGGRELVRLARELDTDLLCARSIIPAAMALFAMRLEPKLKLVFDADGLMADERVDFAGLSPRSASYRLLRDVEAEALRSARSVITRTDKSRNILSARAGAGTGADKIFTVPNGKDPSRFPQADLERVRRVREQWRVPPEAPWLVYVGSLGPQYHPELMLRFARMVQASHPEARLSLFSLSDGGARELLRREPVPNVHVGTLDPERVPEVLAAADLGLAFRTPSFSQQAVCPIKVGEYLLAGTPVVTTGVGDLQQQLAGCEGAFVLSALDESGLHEAARWFERVLPHRERCREACRRTGLEHFALERCIEGYRKALEHADA